MESAQDSTTSAVAPLRSFQGLGGFQAVAGGSDIILVPGMAPRVCFSPDTHPGLDCPLRLLTIV